MNKSRVGFIALGCLAAVALSTLPPSRATGTTPSAKTVTFNEDVAPIFFKNCAECHRPGEAAPFSVLSYKDLRPWAKSIREKIVNREMPPWRADPTVMRDIARVLAAGATCDESGSDDRAAV